MQFFYKVYNLMAWYPWVIDIIKAALNGDIKSRLPIQENNGKMLSVILNGPSLNNSLQYLDRSKTDVMMVNRAIETELYDKLQPEYVCFADPVFFMPSVRNYKLFKKVESINKDTIIFYPGACKQKMLMNNRNVKQIFTTSRLLNVDLFSIKLLEKNLIAPYFINVGVMALYIGIQLGYKKILLYGADMTMFKYLSVNKDLEIEWEDIHYYGKDKINVNRLPQVVKDNDMQNVIQCFQQAFSQFKLIQKYAISEGVKIINMSEESMIDCFEKFRY